MSELKEKKQTRNKQEFLTLPPFYKKKLHDFCGDKAKKPAVVLKDITTAAIRGELVYKDTGQSFFGAYFEKEEE